METGVDPFIPQYTHILLARIPPVRMLLALTRKQVHQRNTTQSSTGLARALYALCAIAIALAQQHPPPHPHTQPCPRQPGGAG